MFLKILHNINGREKVDEGGPVDSGLEMKWVRVGVRKRKKRETAEYVEEETWEHV